MIPTLVLSAAFFYWAGEEKAYSKVYNHNNGGWLWILSSGVGLLIGGICLGGSS